MKTILVHLIIISYLTIQAIAQPLNLTKEEKDFISTHPKITISMMQDYTPFTFIEEGQPVGFEHDLLEIISKKSGLTFEKVIGSWSMAFNAFKDKKVHMISSVSYTKDREAFTLFTTSYYDIPIMIFLRDDFGVYNGPESLKDKKVGITKDIFYQEELESLGTFEIKPYTSLLELTRDLSLHRIDAVIENLTAINYLIKKHGYTNIILADEFTVANKTVEDLRFGVQPKYPLLKSILQKSLDSFTKDERNKLANKWIGTIREYGTQHIQLSEKETAYIDRNVIKYCIDPIWLPFEGLNEKGEHTGMSSDYYKLFEKILSAKFNLVKTSSWSQSLDYLKQKKCDMLALSMETPQRKKYINFTDSYLEIPLVIANKIDDSFINEMKDLKGKKIGITKGYGFVETLKEKYPYLNIVEINNIDEGLDQVKEGKIFAYIDALAAIGHEFQTKYFGELKIAGQLSEKLEFRIAVRNDDEVLLNVMQKAVNSIPAEMYSEILNKWSSIKYERGIDYSLVWKVIAGAIFIFFLIIYWNRKITKANDLLKQAQKDIEEKNKKLEKLATIDNLTNLYNRRKLEELLKLEINRCERFNCNFSLTMLDIDHFKEVNDTYGHQIGDKVLIEIANILRNSIRKTDFAGRYGGEEFIIVCFEAQKEEIIKIIENIRVDIQNHDFDIVGRKTVSFGISIFKDGDTIESMIKRADSALYEAKETGRNKVVLHLK
ncbi:transporter substrate-binding domain-containing protein [uncultured Arcobacter sp.]|uniref:transporter substrate-binding domain-containing diguanylate cyclase n=1 Tax=uncultured Arcobacter sp. TaxID=165434 RepID=UPI002637D9DD|nr:transporter substrate-binding domain-containing protein [uncultured Arcobacter sp.]